MLKKTFTVQVPIVVKSLEEAKSIFNLISSQLRLSLILTPEEYIIKDCSDNVVYPENCE